MTRVLHLDVVHEIECGSFRCRACARLEGDTGDYGCTLFRVDPVTSPGPFAKGEALRTLACIAAEDALRNGVGTGEKTRGDAERYRTLLGDLSDEEAARVVRVGRAVLAVSATTERDLRGLAAFIGDNTSFEGDIGEILRAIADALEGEAP